MAMTRLFILCFLVPTGCFGALKAVTFEWFNLSTNEIWVTAAVGMPPDATPGRLMPSRGESRLEASTSSLLQTIRIGKQIKIEWKDNGKKGWPGGLNPPGSVPPGASHSMEYRRDDLGIPAKLSSGKIRFTYLGDGKWRIRLITADSQ